MKTDPTQRSAGFSSISPENQNKAEKTNPNALPSPPLRPDLRNKTLPQPKRNFNFFLFFFSFKREGLRETNSATK